MASQPTLTPRMAKGIAPADLDAWIDAARPGEWTVFAEGASIPRALPVWPHSVALVGDGLITVTHRPVDGRTWWEFVATRRSNAPVEAQPAAVVASSDDDDPAERVFRLLKRYANFGRACPSNAELARSATLENAAAASWCVRKLRDLGRIRIDDMGPMKPRVVTIVATGKSTLRVQS